MKKHKFICIIMLLWVPLVHAKASFDQDKFHIALKRLSANVECKACNPEHIKLITQAKMNPRAIELKFLNILESGPSEDLLLSYTQKASINKVSNFMRTHQSSLCSTYKSTQVDPYVVTSLLYMETLFGSESIPWFKALDSIVSLVVLEDPMFSAHVIETLKPKMSRYKRYRANPSKWKKYDWQKRATWIAGDWKEHLLAYLEIANMQDWSSEKFVNMKSSWAGAIGYSQFMPQTALPYFEKEQDLDFWKWEDSFMLTSMYLRDQGFDQDTQQALKSYNSPKWYRETILHLSHIMRHKYPEFCDQPTTQEASNKPLS